MIAFVGSAWELVYRSVVVAWLRDERGIRIALPASGLSVGRSADCHVVVEDPHVSRRHAIVIDSAEGVRVVALGKRPVLVNGRPHDGSAVVAPGDRVSFESVSFVVERGDETPRASWALSMGDRRFTVQPSGLRLGGATDADVLVPGWPDRVAELRLDGRSLVLVRHAPLAVDGLVGVGDTLTLSAGMRLEAGAVTLTVVTNDAASATIDAPSMLPSRVELKLVPNGGVARFIVDREVAVWLPQRRCDLVATLLKPPSGFRPGDFLDDPVLISRVWGAEPADRAQLNTLIHRTRFTLSEAGLPGARIIERAQGGGATRLSLGEGAVVQIA